MGYRYSPLLDENLDVKKNGRNTSINAYEDIHSDNYIPSIILFLDYFVQGGLPQVTAMNQWNTLTLPVILPIAVIILLQGQVRNLRRAHDVNWFQTISFFIAFVLTLGAGLILGLYNKYYLDIYDMIPNTAYAAMLSVVGYNFASAYIRSYVARNRVTSIIILFTVLAVFALSPLGELYLPPTKVFGDWWSLYAQGALQAGWGLATYATTVVMMILIFLGKERVRARM